MTNPQEFSPQQQPQNKVQQQVAKTNATPRTQGGGTIFTEDVIVVNQKAKLFEASAQYSVFDQNGNEIAAVQQVNQSKFAKILKLLVKFDGLLTTELNVIDTNGNQLARLFKPRHFFKAKVEVTTASGLEGSINTVLKFGKAELKLMMGEQQVGLIKAENFRAWNFAIFDAAGNQVGKVSKTWAGLGKEFFTQADNYVVEIAQNIQPQLREFSVVSAVAIDAVLKQYKS